MELQEPQVQQDQLEPQVLKVTKASKVPLGREEQLVFKDLLDRLDK